MCLEKKWPFALCRVLDLLSQRTLYLSPQVPLAIWFQCGDEAKTLIFQPFWHRVASARVPQRSYNSQDTIQN